MNFSGIWNITSSSPDTNTGLFVTTESNDKLVITDLSSLKKQKISRTELVSENYKYRCEILWFLEDKLQIKCTTNGFVDSQAAKLIDEICEANRLLF